MGVVAACMPPCRFLPRVHLCGELPVGDVLSLSRRSVSRSKGSLLSRSVDRRRFTRRLSLGLKSTRRKLTELGGSLFDPTLTFRSTNIDSRTCDSIWRNSMTSAAVGHLRICFRPIATLCEDVPPDAVEHPYRSPRTELLKPRRHSDVSTLLSTSSVVHVAKTPLLRHADAISPAVVQTLHRRGVRNDRVPRPTSRRRILEIPVTPYYTKSDTRFSNRTFGRHLLRNEPATWGSFTG